MWTKTLINAVLVPSWLLRSWSLVFDPNQTTIRFPPKQLQRIHPRPVARFWGPGQSMSDEAFTNLRRSCPVQRGQGTSRRYTHTVIYLEYHGVSHQIIVACMPLTCFLAGGLGIGRWSQANCARLQGGALQLCHSMEETQQRAAGLPLLLHAHFIQLRVHQGQESLHKCTVTFGT